MLSTISFRKAREGKYRPDCKKCESINYHNYKKDNTEAVRKTKKFWRDKNPIKAKMGMIRKKLRNVNYSGDIDKKAEIIFKLNKCECCDKKFKNSRDKHIDHCHSKNLYRATICRSCNLTLGYVKDSKEHLQKCIDYLNKF